MRSPLHMWDEAIRRVPWMTCNPRQIKKGENKCWLCSLNLNANIYFDTLSFFLLTETKGQTLIKVKTWRKGELGKSHLQSSLDVQVKWFECPGYIANWQKRKINMYVGMEAFRENLHKTGYCENQDYTQHLVPSITSQNTIHFSSPVGCCKCQQIIL